MQFKVISDELGSSTFQGKERKFRRLLVIGANSELTEQICEIQLPESHAPVGKDQTIDFRIKSISSVFNGKPRLAGEIASGKGR